MLGEHDAAEIDDAVDALLGEDRPVEQPARTRRLAANRQLNSLVRDTWIARIGGLTSLLWNLADVIYGRFFQEEPLAFARTLSFSCGTRTWPSSIATSPKPWSPPWPRTPASAAATGR